MPNKLDVFEPTKYEIKKIILADGTELDINKITHAAVIKSERKGNDISFKITYCCTGKDELISLSNQCNMLAWVFKFMGQHDVSFEEGCEIYDKMIEEGKRLRKVDNK